MDLGRTPDAQVSQTSVWEFVFPTSRLSSSYHYTSVPLDLVFSSSRLDMSGITESNAVTHATRQPTSSEKQIIDDIPCLYQLKPSQQAYSHYA
jgi:hypothetical protein